MVAPPRSVDVARSGKKIGRVKLWNVGVSLIKSELYGWLKLEKNEDGTAPHGYCHFPQYDQHYFKGLTAEQLEFKLLRGFRKYEWVKKFDRNEPLDCRVYARAAASIFGMDRFKESTWNDLSGSYGQNNQEKPKKDKKQSFWDKN
jgi:phage terminase large subunit GpA-like protein